MKKSGLILRYILSFVLVLTSISFNCITSKAAPKTVVVVIDPGHGGNDGTDDCGNEKIPEFKFL